MKNPIAILAAYCTLLFTISVSAATDETSGWPEQVFDDMDGTRLVVFMPSKDIINSPAWLPGELDSPPMTLGQAVSRLKAWLVSEGLGDDTEISSIELKPLKRHEKEHRWYYLFHLQPEGGESGKAMYAAVLFNGAVFPAIIEPGSLQ